jgi:hypothetical protein
VRAAARGNEYRVARIDRHRAVVVRRTADGDEAELARSDLHLRPDWPALARAILGDALDGRFPRRLAEDYSHFIVVPREGVRTTSGQEIQEWLDTWRPPLAALFSSGRR